MPFSVQALDLLCQTCLSTNEQAAVTADFTAFLLSLWPGHTHEEPEALAYLRPAMSAARGLHLAVGEATRPNRTAALLPQLGNVPPRLYRHAVIILQSGSDSELEMDKLADMVVTIQDRADPEAEAYFEHAEQPDLAGRLRVNVLLIW